MRNSKFLRGVALAALATTAGVSAAEAQQTATPAPTLTTSWSGGSPRVSEEDRQFKVTGRIQYDVYNIQADFPGTASDLDYTQTDTRRVFLIWVLVFGLVGAQSGWILRPFVGSPDVPFTWFRPKQGSFFEGVGASLRLLFRGPTR